jgi:hypothetical protein
MFWRQISVSLLLLASSCFAQDDAQAIKDMQVGMQGLMASVKDPELLAQLMQDMQVCTLQSEQ